MTTIETSPSATDERHAAMIDALRQVIRDAHPGLVEEIKWNAPSFALDGEHRITLGIQRRGGVRMVVHRGARPAPASAPGFRFEDKDGLASWPAADRGVLVFGELEEISARRAQLRDFCRAWLEACR